MGVIVDEQELSCSVPASRFFKAFLVSNELMPKVLPVVFKSIEFEGGNGGPGSIKKVSYFDQGGEVKCMKHRVEEVDEANLVYKFTIIEGENIGTDFESVTSVNKVSGGADGGCVLKVTTTYHTKGDNQSVIEESIKKAKDGLTAFFQAAAAHLHSNPNEYN